MVERQRPLGLYCTRGALCGGAAAFTWGVLYAKSFIWWSGSVHSGRPVRGELYMVELRRPYGLFCTQGALRGEVEAFIRVEGIPGVR